jgi:hypothetical protein
VGGTCLENLTATDGIHFWNSIRTTFRLSVKFALQTPERREYYTQVLKFKKASDKADFTEAEDIKRTLLRECNWKSHDFDLRTAFRKQRI